MASHDHRLRVVKGAINGLQEQAGEKAQIAAERIEEAASEIAQYARAATDCLQEWGKDARNSVQGAPVVWSAVALGAVALVGLAATIYTRSRMQRARARARAAAQLRRRPAARGQAPRRAKANGSAHAT